MQSSQSAWKLLGPINELCKHNRACASKLQRFLPKQIWTKAERDEVLNALSDLFILGGDCVVDVCIWLGPLILEVVTRLTQSVIREGHSEQRLLKKIAVIMCKGFPISSELQRFAVDFVQLHKPFTLQDTPAGDEPPRKRAKKNKISDLDWCHAMWSYMVYLPETTERLDIAHLSYHLTSTDDFVRWYASCALSKCYGMSESETSTLLKKYFTQEEQRMFSIRVDREVLALQDRLHKAQGAVEVERLDAAASHTLQTITSADLNSQVVSVMGILLPRLGLAAESDSQISSPLVLVPSTQQHLRSLALAVSSCRPVLLQGPVGCGKTSLVEHLAMLTGRFGFPDILKIQLGDQTDSKALLGTYCSTEVPGEFVWRAGVLTQAVSRGSWVLLEDVDTAPMDVLSLLVALAETRTLMVPGHGDEIRAAPGFQLFTTQRLLGSSDGWHHQRGGNALLLEKLCTVINVEPLSRTELKHVIAGRFPALVPVSDKLLDIYFMLSAGRHDAELPAPHTDSQHTHGRFLSTGGRQISTRDLMTWCSRSSVDFDHKEASQGLRVFLEAVDCFVSCISKQATRLSLASAVGTKLNITEDRSKYFCTEYKPSLSDSTHFLEIGRARVQRRNMALTSLTARPAPTFSYTRSSLVLLEKIAVCINRNEPVLLAGETGTGKTSTVQFLAHYLGHKLHVINLNQQSDSTDLLGGFKPVDLKFVMMPLREEFEMLFCETFSRAQNEKFLSHVQTLFSKRRWSDLLTLIEAPVKKAANKLGPGTPENDRWMKISKRINELRLQIREMENVLAFSFIEGTLVKALRKGDWVLLDEINLATAETLECLSGLLESSSGSIVLTERGDAEPIQRHPDFRLFACMNPATDVGKKDLPVGIRNRFTEFYVEELECPKDLSILVRGYLPGLSLTSKQVTAIVNFYLSIKNDRSDSLMDGTGHRPHFSLRTLCRALMFCARNPCRSVPRSMFEGFCLSFLTQLDRSSHPLVEDLIIKHILASSAPKAVLGQKLPKPEGEEGVFIQTADYWISRGTLEPAVPTNYILTPSVRLNLKDLARVVSAGKHAVLLQGETSVGKTSLITYLAQLTGNVCLRVNNHEHTDIQEYVGSYAADEHGKLVFKEGVLVEAMRKGYWIILDELNLAPTDVLEALNRLLDDNQELYIPETQEMVQAHPKFMLFATQNPPGLYGGRKVLSRAFRNRFIELHFDEIPAPELETILHQRCGIPLSYAKKLVAVMLELQMRRRGSGIFSGKHGFMTLRDLFRWAQRYNCPEAGKGEKFYDWDQHLAEHGYMLLAGRVRKPEEEVVIKEVIEKNLKRKLQIDALYTILPQTSAPLATMLNSVTSQSLPGFQHIVWTHSMRRLAVLIGQAIRFKEPILLVGDTGVGKTTVCQLYSALQGRTLLSINCHMHTESADFLGGLRPVRSHDDSEQRKENMLFEWKDGPLVTAMKEGAMFLIDEISLADDSVLERLNSVLEPERTILLAEKASGGEAEVEKLQAAEHFQVFATMNPGGDFGKKELSPALRNRFTEIWCPQSHDRADLIAVIEKNIHPGLHLYNTQDGTSGFGHAVLEFVEWFISSDMGRRVTVSIRDILSWVGFINTCAGSQGDLREDADAMETDDVSLGRPDPAVAYVHGACLVFIDSLGAGSTTFITEADAQASRLVCLRFLQKQLSDLLGHDFDLNQCQILLPGDDENKMAVVVTEQTLCIPPFHISREAVPDTSVERFTLQAPTTCVNGQRLLRALQLPRPVLLEGSPGVGKTSLVAAIARMARKTLVRINLSEQTDVTDLFGADLPVEGEEGGHFAWRDGPFLQALKAGHWVVFDELNLASQSVLEGLNACFDHRAEVYIPELGKTFHIQHEKTRIFACQNPLSQGGGRKGLPRSFLNRFTQVYVDPLTRSDLLFITATLYPDFPKDMLLTMVDFNSKMQEQTMVQKSFGGRGAPWEFNLRDLFRWCDLLHANQTADCLNPGEYVGLIYKDRMRTAGDKTKVDELYLATFDQKYPLYSSSRKFHIGHSLVQAGHSFLPRGGCDSARPDSNSAGKCLCLHHSLEPLESLMKCVQMGWLTILVGPQSSGKTSLVKLLSKLTGHALCVLPMNSSMDTTELLGGFEQSDVWRHLGVITTLLQTEVRNLGKRCLLEKDAKESSFLRLAQDWTKYRTLATRSEGLSSLEVTALFSQHLQKLQVILGHLESLGHSLPDKLSEIRLLLSHLSITVSNMKPGAGGGAFEWTDSMLVKALKNGDWLLIDNVNFCSASVLDRLNALLEPNGVLTINERGSVNGEIATVVPHPEFRLFFAMDPRYGEISRAMRNRGIEIYLLGEDEGNAYSQPDIFCMLEEMGLRDRRVCQWWLELHASLKSELPFSERPMIADLLHSGSLCVQLRSRGFNIRHAFAYAAEDGYVGNKRNAAAKQLARSIVGQHLEAIPENLSDASIYCTDLQAVTKSWVGEVRQLANVKRDATLILSTLERLSSHNPSQTVSWRVHLQTAVLIFASLQSELSWKLALEWTETVIPTVQSNLVAVSSTEHHIQNVKFMLDSWKTLASDCLNQVFMGSSWSELTRTLEKVFAGSSTALTLLREQPWDLTFNPQASQHAALIHTRETGKTLQGEDAVALSNVQKLISRLQLIQVCVVTAHNLKDKINALEETISKAGRRKTSALPPLGLVSLLLSHVTEELPQLVESLDDASLVYLTEGPHHLLWLKRLADIALTWQNLHKDVFIAHLSLHWHWVEDRLRCLLALAQHHNPKVAMVMEELQRHLGRSDKSIKMHVKFWAAIGHPKPFISEKEAAVVQCLSQITSALTLCCSDSQLTLKRKVDAFTESGLFFQSQIQDIMAFIANGELSEAEKAIQALASFLTRSGLMQACKEAPRLPENEADLQTDAGKILKDSLEGRRKPSQFVSLWPLFGHISLLAEMSAVSSQFLESAVVKSADASMTVDDVETVELSDVAPLRDFVLSHLPDLTDWSLVSRDLSDGHLLEAVQQLFSKLWTSPTCSRPLQWLQWSDHQDEFVAPGENMGPGVLHGVPVCRFAMRILSKNSEITNTVDLLPLHVSLGNLQEQAQEVSLMSRHIWCHSSALGSSEYDIRLLEKQLLQQSFMELMSAMHSFLIPNLQSDWLTALKKMQVSGHFTRQSFGELQNILSCSLHSFPSHISALLPRCLEVVHDAGCETSPSRSVPLVGHGLVYVGLLLAQFLSPKGSIDPVEKTRLKLSHVEKELEELEAELSTWNQHLEMRTGRGISETHRDHLHPRVLAQLQRQDKLRTGRGTLQQSSAYRPDQIQYIQLSQAIRSFMESSCSVSKITDLVSRLNNTGSLTSSHQGDVSLTAALQEERVWQDTTERFIQRLKSSFQCYMDIVVPFCAGVQEMKLGLRLLAHNCHKSLKTRKLGSYHNITSLVGTLCSFPTVSQALPDLLSLANQMSSSSVQDAIVSVLLSSSANDVKEEMRATKSRLLLCSLLLLKAHSFISRRLDSKFIATLSSVLDLFSSAWGEQEEQRKQKELEESALFKYKEQVHGDERSEHERQEADFRSAYPSFEKDFMDVTGAVRLEDVGLEQRQGEPANSSIITSLDGISPKEMAQVCLAHSEILITLSQADWLERNPLDCVADMLTPALMSYQIGTTVVRTAYDVLDPETDGQVLGSHLLVGGSVLQYLELQNGSSVMQDFLKKPSGKSYNIYYDANVPEVMKCKAVIDSLRRRVRELQLGWPDHPTLVLLNQIMDRILSFSVTSTVVKFLTGLELLLQKAQDWESNASSSVSMASQLSEITAVIVSWRKLELSCWSSALDREEEKCKEKASHWWFHLFQVTSAFVTTDHSSNIKETDKAAILDALKKFMESSTMGEYSFRLQMLLAFHCQLLYMDSSPAQKHLVHILWNIHQFYKQYQPSVEAEIKRLRSPIDKQLKGFVKIARWSDLNYWALKTSTEKTHRTVHKYIKEYQAVLHQPAKSMLGDKGDDLVAQAVKQTAGFPLEEQTTTFTQCVTGRLRSAQAHESSLLKLPSAVSDDVPLLCRMPSLFKKMKKHLIKYVAETRDVKMTLVFDDFTGELIQEIHELQGLQVDMSAEKEKQKSEARAFNLRKRKSLAELFKCLSEIGLSYRKGVSGKAGRGFSEALELPPLNLQAHPELAVTKLWTGCEAYFYRCISRYAQFSAAVVSPSKELTMADIERIRGFIEHFSLLYIEQRDRLSSLASSFLSLNKMLVSVKSLEKSSSYSIPPQTESHSWLAQVKQLTTQLSEGMLQFQLLLESCPSDHQHLSLVNVHPSPLPRSRLAPSAFWSRGDAAWTQCFNTLQIMVKNVRAEQTVIDKLLNKVILVRSDMETVSKILGAYKHLTSQLSEISSHFNQDSTGDKCCLVSTFSYLCSQISNIHDSFHVWYHKIGARPCVEGSEAAAGGSMQDSPTALVRDTHTALCDEFLSKTESLVEALLLSVQNVMKVRQLSVQDGAKDDDTEKSEELEEDLKEAHLTKHLLDVEKNVITHLGCDQISAKLQDLISSLCRRSDEASSSSSQSLMATTSPGSLALGCKFLLQSLPLVSAYCSLVENQLGLSVTLHRSMGKLLSVLLAVFTELSQKGFCIPPELSEEVAGEGATEFKDIESGGLGEGEGAKDVSDQIESEDQLEEARKPGQEDKAEDPQDQPDIPSEDNAIEMSDDFDGKLHNKDGADKEEDNENEANEDEDMEKQMGEADGEQNDRLDERMWGSDDEEEEGDGEDEKDTKDDQGAGGMDRQKEEMVAKDDNKDATEAQDDTEDDAQKDTEEKRQNELMEDDDDYDDNQVDPHNKEEKEEDAENLDLSTDLNLDDGEKNDKDAGDDNDDAENKDDDDANTNSDETPEQEPEAGKDENAEEVEDVQANKPEPQDLENNEDKSGEDNLQNMTAEKEEEKEGEGAEGASGQEEEKPTAELGRDEDDVTTSDDKVDTADDAGDVAQHTETADSLGRGLEQENTQQEEEATREKQDKKEEENIGAASSEDQEGHQGQQSSQKSDASGAHQQQVQQRNPGQSDNERSLGSHDKEHRRLKTKDESQNRNDEEQDTHNEDETRQTSLEYEHIKDAKSHCDAQTIDVASKEQMLDKQAVPSQLENEGDELEDEDDVGMEVDEGEMDTTQHPEKKPAKSKDQKKASSEENAEQATQKEQKTDTEGERVLTLTADRAPESSVHTLIENLHMDAMPQELDLDALRTQLEQCVSTWSHPQDTSLDVTHVALEAWQKYQTITGALSQELCEQLRLILEPSQATKLKGDYRTGKRLNMRKVIPYIASQFRKDKIWLRRSKPSKRLYQIMIAIDDSASMADNHSKQLAFESLALVSNALTLLESGELSVCSFGEDVRLLHPFAEPFSNQSGAKILQQLSCEQTQTKYGMLLDQVLAMFVNARSRLSSMAGDAETAQLLLILSDGNGVFREGMDVVRRAVRRARSAKIFLVFIILDNPERKSSILDSKVPIMEPSGQIREIKSYMEMFPFPFYILLRDINCMPQILSDALRQWFELVTSSDR